MINAEKYKKQIKEVGYEFGFDGRKIISCGYEGKDICEGCIFYHRCNCAEISKWLLSEEEILDSEGNQLELYDFCLFYAESKKYGRFGFFVKFDANSDMPYHTELHIPYKRCVKVTLEEAKEFARKMTRKEING